MLKDTNENENLLIKRFTLQIEDLKMAHDQDSSDEDEFGSNNQVADLDEWNFRESILKCLYSKHSRFPAGSLIYGSFFKLRIRLLFFT